MSEQLWVKTWLIDFYDASKTHMVNEREVLDGPPLETVEIERAYAPTRWAKTHCMTLTRKLHGTEVTYSITAT